MPHKRLLGKLELYGIHGEVHKWISNFLVGRKQSVVVDGERSEERDVKSGVPQGTVLGPLLFLLHINDIVAAIDPHTKCRLFADDCLLYRVVKSVQDQVQLQRDLRNLERWATDWGMRFNASKCYVMTVGKGSTNSYMYELCGTFLQGVTQEKYLGVLISSDLSWTTHIQNVASSANQKLGFMKRNLKGSPKELKKLAYLTTVRSSLEYASTIWDPHQQGQKQLLEATQRKAARWIQNDFSRTSSVSSMMVNLGLEPLEEGRRISRLAFLYKILHEEVAVPASELGIIRNPRATRGLYTRDKLIVPRCNTTQLQNHFVSRTIPQWNKLPDDSTSAGSVQAFKRKLSVLPSTLP